MRNLEERLDDIRDIVSETLKDCKRSLGCWINNGKREF